MISVLLLLVLSYLYFRIQNTRNKQSSPLHLLTPNNPNDIFIGFKDKVKDMIYKPFSIAICVEIQSLIYILC